MSKIIIIGAGLAGLSAAYHAKDAGYDYDIYEKEGKVGGLCRTINKDGFYFDYGGHLLHIKDSYIQDLIRELLGNNMQVIERKAYIFSNGVYTRYPFQANLYGLPSNIIKECLLGYVNAYCKNMQTPSAVYSNFKEWVLGKFGFGIAKYFMYPYNEKLWTVPVDKLTCEWISEYVPMPSIDELFDGAFSDQTKGFGYNSVFWYPRKGGIQVLADAFAEKVGTINFNENIKQIHIKDKTIEFCSGKKVNYDKLISTIPLNKIIGMIKGDVPGNIKESSNRLKHNSVLIVNLGVMGEGLTEKHWIYLPEKKYIAYRIGVFSNFSSQMAPDGTSSYYVEISYDGKKEFHSAYAINKAIKDLINIGLIPSEKDILIRDVVNIECAYVIYDEEYKINRDAILDYLLNLDINSIGRYGGWEYSAMEEAITNGKKAIKMI